MTDSPAERAARAIPEDIWGWDVLRPAVEREITEAEKALINSYLEQLDGDYTFITERARVLRLLDAFGGESVKGPDYERTLRDGFAMLRDAIASGRETL